MQEIIIIFGPPGSGKGTQGKVIAQKRSLDHISTGDIIRAEINSKSALGQEAKRFADSGILAPDALVSLIVDSYIKNHPESKGFLLDGYPRNITQANDLDKIVQNNDCVIKAIINLLVTPQESAKRLLKRADIEGRYDDTPQVIQTRLEVFTAETAPVLYHYAGLPTYHEINGHGPEKTITERINRILRTID